MSHPQDPLQITPTLLLRAYASGVFPMAEGSESGSIYWVDPQDRGVIPLNGFHVSRSMHRFLKNAEFDVRINSDFCATVTACANRKETWINDEIKGLYETLHRLGYAHSVEVWNGAGMVGGVYGVAIGGAFFGESMFSTQTNMSKVALMWLVARLRAGGYQLLDTQFITEHLASLGAIEISRAQYHSKLETALQVPGDFFKLPPNADADQVLHLIAQTS